MSDQCAFCNRAITNEPRLDDLGNRYCSRDCSAEAEAQRSIDVVQQHIDSAQSRNQQLKSSELSGQIRLVQYQLSIAKKEKDITTKLNLVMATLATAAALSNFN